MADLSTLDVTQPPDTQAVSQGAARIRETRVATVTSFGIEHALTGEHKFLYGTTAGRPAAGHSGRIYFNIEIGALELDNGSTWVKAPVVPKVSQSTAGNISIGAGFGAIEAYVQETSDGTLVATGEFALIGISNPVLQYRITVDGTLAGFVRTFAATGAVTQVFTIHATAVVTAGFHTINLEAFSGAGTITVSDRFLMTEVL